MNFGRSAKHWIGALGLVGVGALIGAQVQVSRGRVPANDPNLAQGCQLPCHKNRQLLALAVKALMKLETELTPPYSPAEISSFENTSVVFDITFQQYVETGMLPCTTRESRVELAQDLWWISFGEMQKQFARRVGFRPVIESYRHALRNIQQTFAALNDDDIVIDGLDSFLRSGPPPERDAKVQISVPKNFGILIFGEDRWTRLTSHPRFPKDLPTI